MVHRRFMKCTQVIHRNVTAHALDGIQLQDNEVLIASFQDIIAITHKGKHLDAYFHIKLKEDGQGKKLNIQFKLQGKKMDQQVKVNMLPSIENEYHIDLK